MANEQASQERLDSWKEIAAYLGRDVRTVIRWEKERGLPVHRVPGGQRQSVFAYREELDRWLDSGEKNQQSVQIHEPPNAGTPSDRNHSKEHHLPVLTRKFVFVALSVIVLAACGAALLFSHRPTDALVISGITQLTDDASEKLGLVTDGSRLYFSEREDGRYQIVTVPVSGGMVRALPGPDINAVPVDIAPDGSQLLILTFRGYEELRSLWILPLDGRSPRRVGNIDCQSAAWSPDGHGIVYSVGNEIDITTDEGNTSTKLLVHEIAPSRLQWSRDGRYLRFIANDPSTMKYTAWEVAIAGNHALSEPTQIGKEITNWAAWSKSDVTGSFLALVQPQSSTEAVFKLADGSVSRPEPIAGLQRLGESGFIATEPTGTRFFLNAGRQQRTELFRIETNSNSFIPFLPEIGGTFLDFSGDGKWITYVSTKDDSLWASNADGGDARRLDFSSVHIELPRFSPDGSQIAYMSKRADLPWRILIVSREGGTPHEAASGNDSQGAPTWSPDGKFIVYGGVDCQQTSTCAIHRIDLATRNVETIPGSAGLGTARWSPDGRYIAALRATNYQVWLFDLRSKRWRKLADSLNGNDLSWSHDSRYVYAKRAYGEHLEMVRIRVSDGRIELVADLADLNKLPGRVETWFGLTPDDMPVVLRWITGSEIYSAKLSTK